MQHEDAQFWGRRPLSLATQRYAAADALFTLQLHAALTSELAREGVLDRVRSASAARVCELADLTEAAPQQPDRAHCLAPDF